jgi:CheY-like chemotaxis protein
MPPPAPSPNDGWRILVTDDNPTKLYALTQTLRDAGHCVFAAYDGESALELVTLLPELDLLITNTRLGHVDGPELMRRSRALKANLPILHVAHDQAGDDGVPPNVPTLREPFTPNQLLTAIQTLMAGRREGPG